MLILLSIVRNGTIRCCTVMLSKWQSFSTKKVHHTRCALDRPTDPRTIIKELWDIQSSAPAYLIGYNYDYTDGAAVAIISAHFVAAWCMPYIVKWVSRTLFFLNMSADPITHHQLTIFYFIWRWYSIKFEDNKAAASTMENSSWKRSR